MNFILILKLGDWAGILSRLLAYLPTTKCKEKIAAYKEWDVAASSIAIKLTTNPSMSDLLNMAVSLSFAFYMATNLTNYEQMVLNGRGL